MIAHDRIVSALRDLPENIELWAKGKPNVSPGKMRTLPRDAWELARKFPPGCLVRGCDSARGALAIVSGYGGGVADGRAAVWPWLCVDAEMFVDGKSNDDPLLHAEDPSRLTYVGYHRGQSPEWVAQILRDD